MSGVNKVILVGRLGADPEMKTTDTGRMLSTFRVATTRRWRDNEQQPQEETEWHRVIAWGKTAENVGKYLAKGRQVFIEGRIQTHKWKDKEGNDRFSTEVVAHQVTFLSNKAGEAAQLAA